MLITAALGLVFAVLQILALERRPARFSVAALLLYGTSAVLFWWAVSATRGKLAACGQRVVSAAIVETGPYRYIRHPFYTSYNLTWVAGFVASGWWPLALGSLIMAAVYQRAAHEEESLFLASPLAGQYRDYKRRTGRYLPFI